MIARLRLLLASVLVVLVACTTTSSTPDAPADDDDTPRLVSLSPAITETLIALDAEEQLVGRSDWCTGPPEVMALPALGSALTPNLEGVVRARPSAVLVEKAEGAALDPLRRLSTVHALPWLTTEDVVSSTRRLGALTDRAPRAEALADRLQAALTPKATPEAPRVLLVLGVDGPTGDIWYIKPNSLHGSALLAAGGRNAIPAAVQGAPSMTAERVLALDPDVIVLLSSEPLDAEARAAAIARWSELTPLTAVKHGHVRVLAQEQLLSTGPGVLGFVEALSPLVRAQSPD